MISAKTNVIANFSGRIWVALVSIIFVPLYLRYLSAEVYGIIGVFSTLQVILTLMDVGLSATLSRELARNSAFPEKRQETRDLVRTIELPYWILALLILVVTALISPLIAHYWVNPIGIDTEAVASAIAIMGIGFAFQWLSNFYSGGLIGLQHQKALNIINIIFATIRGVGSLLVLIYISQTIQAFLLFQAAITGIQSLTIAWQFKRNLPKSDIRPRFQKRILSKTWKYAAGTSAISIVVLGYSQVDKIILSRMFSLEAFGYYTLAGSLATMGIEMISGAVSTSYFPKFSQFVALNDAVSLKRTYHQACQVLNAIMIPVAGMFAIFAPEILLVWSKNQQLSEGYSVVLTLMAIGMGVNSMMVMPYYLQLANGYTKLTIWSNLAALFVLIPLMIFLTTKYGIIGGPITWLILNLGHLFMTMTIFYRMFLKGEQKRWYLVDILPPLISVVVVFLIGRYLFPADLSRFPMLMTLAFIFICGFIVSALSLPLIRHEIFSNVTKLANPKSIA